VDTPAAGLEITALAPDVAVHDATAFVPRSVSPDWVGNQPVPPWGVDAVYVRAARGTDIAATQQAATRLLQQAQVATQRLTWITPATLAAGLNRLREMVAAVAGGVSLLSLILGGITLVSLMIANVQDRVAEIGLRRTFGANPGDVAMLFVAEALLLCLAATGAGTVAGVLLLELGPKLPLPMELDALTLLGPLCMGTALGVVTAWWPARIAARIEPAQALRAI
jgi:putative ABC transport system permease protein